MPTLSGPTDLVDPQTRLFPHPARLIKLTARKRVELEATIARPSAAAGFVRRARVVLLSADGVTGTEIATRLDLTPEAVSRIRRRFRDEGVGGLADRPKTGRTDNKFHSRRSKCRSAGDVAAAGWAQSLNDSAAREGSRSHEQLRVQVVRQYPGRELHVIVDNSSTHGTRDVQAWARGESERAIPLHSDERILA